MPDRIASSGKARISARLPARELQGRNRFAMMLTRTWWRPDDGCAAPPVTTPHPERRAMIIISHPAQIAQVTRGTPATMARTLAIGQALALSAMYLTTFALAALSKWSGGVPGWFIDQFHATWIASMPGGLPAVFYGLAVLESLAALGFALSLLTGEFLHAWRPAMWLSLLGAQFIFIILAFGSRLTGHHDVAGWNFVYFAGTVALLHLNRRRDGGDAA
jgi:hypothetical protein